MSTVATFRVWGELEKWYLELPEGEKATNIRQAIRRGLESNTGLQQSNIQYQECGMNLNNDVKAELEVGGVKNDEDLDSKLDNFNMWEG